MDRTEMKAAIFYLKMKQPLSIILKVNSYAGLLQVRDMETGAVKVYSAREIKKGFLRGINI